MVLNDFIYAIRGIAAENSTTLSNAKDMFLANVRNSVDPNAQYHYNGAEWINYKALYPHLTELENSNEAFGLEYGNAAI